MCLLFLFPAAGEIHELPSRSPPRRARELAGRLRAELVRSKVSSPAPSSPLHSARGVHRATSSSRRTFRRVSSSTRTHKLFTSVVFLPTMRKASEPMRALGCIYLYILLGF